MAEEKFNYSFDKSTGILYKYYYGSITIEDIHSSWDYAINKNLIPKETQGIILDYQKATFNIKANEYSRISDYYKEHLDVFRNQKIAVITQSQKDVVIPVLVETKDSGYSSRPFYTVEAAIKWVLNLI
jgi:hypothetical protein